MYLTLLLLRTAIGMLTGVLVWMVLGNLTDWGPLPMAVVSGVCGGMVCVSLGPSIGQQLALICGLVMTVVAFFTAWDSDAGQGNIVVAYWPLWILPAYSSGGAMWLLLARALQKKTGGT